MMHSIQFPSSFNISETNWFLKHVRTSIRRLGLGLGLAQNILPWGKGIVISVAV